MKQLKSKIGHLTLIVMNPTYASSEPSMNTNVESLVFSMMTFSATFPGAMKIIRKVQLDEKTKQMHNKTVMTSDTYQPR